MFLWHGGQDPNCFCLASWQFMPTNVNFHYQFFVVFTSIFFSSALALVALSALYFFINYFYYSQLIWFNILQIIYSSESHKSFNFFICMWLICELSLKLFLNVGSIKSSNFKKAQLIDVRDLDSLGHFEDILVCGVHKERRSLHKKWMALIIKVSLFDFLNDLCSFCFVFYAFDFLQQPRIFFGFLFNFLTFFQALKLLIFDLLLHVPNLIYILNVIYLQ